MSRIISPNTIYKHRLKLHSTLTSIKTNLEPYREHQKLVKNKGYMFLDAQQKREFRSSLTDSFMKLLSEWRGRALRLKIVRSQIAGILEQLTDPYCKFCGSAWGLKCESIDNIEDVFEQFRTEQLLSPNPDGIAPDFCLTKIAKYSSEISQQMITADKPRNSAGVQQDLTGEISQRSIESRQTGSDGPRAKSKQTGLPEEGFKYRKSDWQRFFVSKAVFRTLCYECNEAIRPKTPQELEELFPASNGKDKSGGIVSVLKKSKPFDKVKSALNKIGFTRFAPETKFKDEIEKDSRPPSATSPDVAKGERFARVAKAVIKRKKEEQQPRGDSEPVKVTRFSPNTKLE